MEVCCIVLGAGSGSRFGAQKQFASIGDKSILEMSIAVAKECADLVVVVRPPEILDSPVFARADVVVSGGATRSESVRLGLAVVPEEVRFVLIHDGARPLADVRLYERVLVALRNGAKAVVPFVAVTDTLKRMRGGVVIGTVDREDLGSVQTPQGFVRSAIMLAHDTNDDATDDATLCERAGFPVIAVKGDPTNIKITYPSDLAIAAGIVESRTTSGPVVEQIDASSRWPSLRVGSGFDSHRFDDQEGTPLVLCGVVVPGRGLRGHSDGDVGCHAVADALLGAVGLGGIGDYFSDQDPKYAKADSTGMLSRCLEMTEEQGYRLVNVDLTLILETPMVAPYRMQMQETMTSVLGAPVCVKAKRPEGLGALGRGEGIAALASALLVGEI